MSAFIILLSLPGNTLTFNGTEVETQGGFRGFHSVPPGKHQISIEGYSGQKITLELELTDDEVDVRSYNYETGTFERAAPDQEAKYSRLAASGAMGIALWPYPPAVRNITDPDRIATILESANRLKFVLVENYELSLEDLQAIGVGKDTIGIRTPEKSLFFQIADRQEVLMPPVYGVSPVEVTYEPWLWQNLLEIINEYGN